MKRADLIFPLRGKMVAKRPVGGKSGGHGFSPSRDHSLSLVGRREAAGANPETVMCFCVSARPVRFAKLFLTVRIGAHEREFQL